MALIKTPGGEFYLDNSQFEIDYEANVVRLVAQGGGDTGVQSFNGRTGAVMPQDGDYTAEQVGAVPISGGTMTGALVLSGDPTQDLEPATKQYVDEVRESVHSIGDTVNDIIDGTEALPYLSEDYQPPVATAEVAGTVKIGAGINVTEDGVISVTDQGGLTQVEADERYLQLEGGTMTGNLDMGSNKIVTTYVPTDNADVANKGYVDGVVKVVSDEIDGILSGTTPVTVPVATDAHVGGIKVGAGLSVTGDGTLSLTQNAMLQSLPDQFMEGIYNVTRTATTNTAQIRLYIKQEDGTYSPDEQHGVLTLIPAGHGPDDIDGAGLMTYADKVKLDAIPAASAENNGKILVVENGAYTFKTLAELQGV